MSVTQINGNGGARKKMVFVVDDLGAWLVGLLADAGRIVFDGRRIYGVTFASTIQTLLGLSPVDPIIPDVLPAFVYRICGTECAHLCHFNNLARSG